jgi:hypothetical protein
MKVLIQQIAQRSKSETPPFFKKIRKILIYIVLWSAGAGSSIYGVHELKPDFLPEIAVELGKWLSLIGVIGGTFGIGVASITTSDPDLRDKN